MYHNKDFNPDEDSIERDKLNYPDEDEPQPTPTYLIGTVYGADRDSLSVSSQGMRYFILCDMHSRLCNRCIRHCLLCHFLFVCCHFWIFGEERSRGDR